MRGEKLRLLTWQTFEASPLKLTDVFRQRATTRRIALGSPVVMRAPNEASKAREKFDLSDLREWNFDS